MIPHGTLHVSGEFDYKKATSDNSAGVVKSNTLRNISDVAQIYITLPCSAGFDVGPTSSGHCLNVQVSLNDHPAQRIKSCYTYL